MRISSYCFLVVTIAAASLGVCCQNRQDVSRSLDGKNGALVQAAAKAVAGGAAIAGRVVFEGKPPVRARLMIVKDVSVCSKADHLDERLVVGEGGGIKDAVVSIQGVHGGKSLDSMGSEFVLDQKDCTYFPHVLLVPVNTPLKIINDDGILHNIHTFGKRNQPVNLPDPPYRKKLEIVFTAPEKVPVRCDVHGWMNAWVIAVDNPYYAVSDADGKFVLTDVPAGTYHVTCWQEALGEKTTQITVKSGERLSVVFAYDSQVPKAVHRLRSSDDGGSTE